jgi:hypothetical protein
LLPEGSRVVNINGYNAGALAKEDLQQLLVSSLTLTIVLMPVMPTLAEVSRSWWWW